MGLIDKNPNAVTLTHTGLIIDTQLPYSEHYLPDLDVNDEGQYWEIGSIETLKEKMALIDGKIATLSDEFSRMSRGNLDKFSADEVASMTEALIQNKFDKKSER